MKKYLTNKDIWSRVGITVLVITIFRIGSHITVPEIDQGVLKTLDSFAGDGVIPTFLNGKLSIMSLFALGVTPYITASIIIQLLEMDILPKLAEWKDQGEEGRRKKNEVVRIMALIFAYIQAVGIMFGLNLISKGYLITVDPIYYFVLAIIMVAGTALLLWLSDIITEKGVGNGVSVLIVTSIVAGISGTINTINTNMFTDVTGFKLASNTLEIAISLIVIILVLIAVIYFIQGKRNITINYVGQAARSERGGVGAGTSKNVLPLRINTAGVIPVIFASTLMIIPKFITYFVENEQVKQFVDTMFNYQTSLPALVIFCGLVFGFSLLYSFIQINPTKVAENLDKQNAYISGIRPGVDTSDYIERVLYRITFWGGLMLVGIVAFPIIYSVLMNMDAAITVGGTPYIIMIGVIIEILKQLSSKVEKTNYRGFI